MNQEQSFTHLVNTLLDNLGEGLVSLILFGSRARGEVSHSSDQDIFLLSRELPENPFDRQLYLRGILFNNRIFGVSILAKTVKEFEEDLLAIYLDIAYDGAILFDKGGYMQRKIEEIRRIVKERGLVRVRKRGEWVWGWEKQPPPGQWEINWDKK